MSRIRSLHPGLFTDDRYMSLSFPARELIKGIWCECDDQGVFEWRPLTLKMRILPADAVDVGALLAELVQGKFVLAFDADDRKFGAVRNFRKYQRPQKPNAVYPLPDELRAYVAIEKKSDDPTQNLRAELCREQNGECYYCRTEITHYSKRQNSLDIDHRIPTSRGGSDERGNLVAACRACNRGKNNRSEAEWMEVLSSRLAQASQRQRPRLAHADQGQLRLQPADNGENPRVARDKSAIPRLAPQMEEGGGRRKDEGKERILNTHPESVAARPPAAPAGVCEDFSVLWGCWLNREGRTQAERAYAAARRQVDAATILAAADAYTAKIIAKYPAAADRERYGGQLANWLRGARWQDWAEAEQRYDVDIEPVSEVDWRSQMLFWTNPNRGGPTRERWQVEVWGPMPGDPGCRVPPHLTEIAWRDAGAA